jgi:hypothetical protein
VQEKADRLYDKYGSGKFSGDEPIPEGLSPKLTRLSRIWFAYFKYLKAAYRQDRRLAGVYRSALDAAESFRSIKVNDDWRSEFVNMLARIKNTHAGLYAIKKARAANCGSSKTAGRPMTMDEYIRSKGVDTFPPGEPGLHRTPRRLPKTQQRENSRMMLKRQNAWQKQIDALREEYRQKVMDGAIRPPSRVEKLLDTAKGYPEHSSTQAARRILRKQGLWDDQLEEETDARWTSGKEASYDEMATRIAEDFVTAKVMKRRMPQDRNLGTRVHRDKKKFHRTKRQKEKQRLKDY